MPVLVILIVLCVVRALLPYRPVCAYFLFLLFNELADCEGPHALERVLHTHKHKHTRTHTHGPKADMLCTYARADQH